MNTTATNNIGVYVINLDRRPDRLAMIAAQLDAQGVTWERFQALDAQDSDDTQMNAEINFNHMIMGAPRGAAFCALSHFEVWRHFLKSPYEAAIILEDDVTIAPDFAQFAKTTDWLPSGAQLIKIEKYGRRVSKKLVSQNTFASPAPFRVLQDLLSRHGGAGGYLLTRKGAEHALENKAMLRVPVDHLLFNPNVSKLARDLKPIQLNPAIVIQTGDGALSDISFSGENGTDGFLGLLLRNIRKLVRGYYELNLLPSQLWKLIVGKAVIAKIYYADSEKN